MINFGTDNNNNRLVPQAISIKSIEIDNYKTAARQTRFGFKSQSTADITDIVAKASISESIYSPTLKLKLGIKDSINFLESFPITGHEVIRVQLEQKSPYQSEDYNSLLTFYVTDYPTFGKGENESVQVYTIEAISEHAYISGFKKISRSYKNPPVEEIESIILNDLEVDSKDFVTAGQDISKSKGVINIQTPLSAVEFLRKNMYDSNGTPFFLFQILDRSINLISLSKLVDEKSNPSYSTYYDFRNSVAADPNGAEAYDEMRRRIVDVSSNLKLAKYAQGRNGAFASENNFLDWSNKSYSTILYNYLDDVNTSTSAIENNHVLSPLFRVFNTSLNKLPSSNQSYISKNDEAFPEDINYGSSSQFGSHYIKAHHSLLDTITHDIKLHGDINLNAGRIITLKFPKAIDPQAKRDLDMPESELYDETLSGKYLITSCIHEVEDGEYFCNLRVKRDSFSVGF